MSVVVTVRLLAVLVGLSGLFVAGNASAARPLVRYALIVGNNEANAPGVTLPPLRHAEREAAALREQLVRYGQFDPEGTLVVAGGGREDVLRAARALAARHHRMRESLGGASTLFAFVFTGHGLAGQLLTRDEPLTGADLGAIFREVDATLTVGLFDACFSGSLDPDTLRAKGAISTPGFNPIAELPNEVLNAEGTLWFVSSRPNEQSFEDAQLGGLFTHFFIESFTTVPPDRLGVTLDAMWEYARSKTTALAARHGRTQTPVKVVRNFKAEGPVYFSFPRERRARLRFAPEVEGQFLVQYEEAGLVERIVKRAGASLEVALFSGMVQLSRIGAEATTPAAEFRLTDGQQVVVAAADVARPRTLARLGEVTLRTKGELPGLAFRQQPVTELQLVVGAGAAPVTERIVSGTGLFSAGVRVQRGRFGFGAEGLYAGSAHAFEAWRYSTGELGLRLSASARMELGRARLEFEGLAGPSWLRAKYGTGDVVHNAGAWTGGGLRLAVPVTARGMRLEPWARLNAGVKWSRGAAEVARGPATAFQPVLQLGIAVPVSKR